MDNFASADGVTDDVWDAVLAVNLTITLWIGEWLMAAAGIVVHLLAFLLLYNVNRVTAGRWSTDPVSAPAVSGGE